MRRLTLGWMLVAAVALPAVASAEPLTWQIDPAHTSVTFKIRHLLTKVQGQFSDVSGTIVLDPEQPTAGTVDVTIAAASIDTRNEKRNNHLKSADFFDVEKYPDLTFKSTKVEKDEDGHFQVSGELTMHGVTRPVVLDAEILGTGPHPMIPGGKVAGFTATTTLNRKDFGIVWNRTLDTGGTLLGDDVEVTLDVEALWTPPQSED